MLLAWPSPGDPCLLAAMGLWAQPRGKASEVKQNWLLQNKNIKTALGSVTTIHQQHSPAS